MKRGRYNNNEKRFLTLKPAFHLRYKCAKTPADYIEDAIAQADKNGSMPTILPLLLMDNGINS